MIVETVETIEMKVETIEMKVETIETKVETVSLYCIIDPVSEVKILGVTIDEKMTFEKHLRSVARSASSRLGLMRRARYFFR